MIVSPDALRKDTVRLLQQIETQIDEVRLEAAKYDVPPEKMRDANGSWVMIPLLLAKAQGYATLVQLNDQGKKR
jgi:hypothetical protein